eukprot:3806177-Prymnesium_polylepis.1
MVTRVISTCSRPLLPRTLAWMRVALFVSCARPSSIARPCASHMSECQVSFGVASGSGAGVRSGSGAGVRSGTGSKIGVFFVPILSLFQFFRCPNSSVVTPLVRFGAENFADFPGLPTHALSRQSLKSTK